MQNPAFKHLSSILQRPETSAITQAEYNKNRLKKVEDALLLRPFYLPVQHTLPAAAQDAPIDETTDQERFDLIVTGAITDAIDRNVNFFYGNQRNSLVNYGREANVKLSLDAIAGKSIAAAGFAGVKNFSVPFHLTEQDYLTLEMYQETTPGATEIVTTCFNAYRTFKPANLEAQLSDLERAKVLREISKRRAPEERLAVCKVAFDANGEAEAETPKDDEPYFILGFRSTFTDAMVRAGFDSNRSFSRNPFPIWAIANEDSNARQTWNMLLSPLFVPSKEQLVFRLQNTIDGVNFASDGNIEVLRRTV